MQKAIRILVLACVFSFSLHLAMAQQPQTPAQQATAAVAAAVAEPEVPRVVLQAESTASVLRLMKFSGALRDRAGNARTGAVGLTFAFYKDQQGGSPLWLEVHNAQLDEQGRYTVLLGSTKSEGLPLELFSSGEARWLGVQLNLPGEEEQSRVLLVSVPYALKAADAETLGGKPPSAFLLAEEREKAQAKPEAGKEAVKEGPTRQAVQTLNFVQKQGAGVLEDSSIFDNGFVGIGTTNPGAHLDILGTNAHIRLREPTIGGAEAYVQSAEGKAIFGALGFHTLQFKQFTTVRMVIDPEGKVGIRTTNPVANLDILGNDNTYLRLLQLGAGKAQTYVQASYGNGILGTIGNHALQFKPNQRVRMVIDPAGNVGIGTAAPAQKFEVNGNVKISGGGNGLMFPDGSVQTSAPLGGGAINPQQVALLRWYSANQTTSFAVGTAPEGLAFDGANIWVANEASNNVTKLRASDGANLGTFPVGTSPMAVAFDGANIWVANFNSSNVTKLRASDGANLGTFNVGVEPAGVAFDGANIWVTADENNNITKLRASDGANLGSFTVGPGPRGVAFDGANIWVANFGFNFVTKLRASDGANLGTFPVGISPIGAAFDGANIWVTNFHSNNVTKLRASDAANLGTFVVGTNPIGVAFDGANIWVTADENNNITKLRASDGANLGTFPVGPSPWGAAFDGANIWVANNGTTTVSKL